MAFERSAVMTRPKGKRKTQDPCLQCGLHKSLCICHLIPHLNLRTRIVLVIHHRELKRTTNTGALALRALENSIMKVRGEQDSTLLGSERALDLSDVLTPDYRTFLFYPFKDALELTSELVNQSLKPIQLIVPDGNWRQASKVHSRHSELRDIPRVMIGAPNLSPLHLRKENTEHGMATLQAIAAALEIIEGLAVGQALKQLYQAKLERTLVGRGQLKLKD